MALLDRLFRDNADPDFKDYISNHAFSGAMWFFAKGDITRVQVIAAFDLSATDEVQMDQLITHYQSLSAEDKRAFHSDLESGGVLAEQGLISRTQYKALLGLT